MSIMFDDRAPLFWHLGVYASPRLLRIVLERLCWRRALRAGGRAAAAISGAAQSTARRVTPPGCALKQMDAVRGLP